MLKSSLCNYSDAYILVNGTISVKNTATQSVDSNNNKKMFNNFAPFTDCISEINSTQVDNGKNIYIVIQNIVDRFGRIQ